MTEDKIMKVIQKLNDYKFKPFKLTPSQAVEILEYIHRDTRLQFDVEMSHILADHVMMCVVNNQKVNSAFNRINKWYS